MADAPIGHDAHDLDAGGDDDVVGAGHDALGREVGRLLRRAALAVDGGAGTVLGQAGAKPALRPMLSDCSPTCMTQPMMTSSTSAGSRSLRSTSALSVSAARSTGCQS